MIRDYDYRKTKGFMIDNEKNIYVDYWCKIQSLRRLKFDFLNKDRNIQHIDQDQLKTLNQNLKKFDMYQLDSKYLNSEIFFSIDPPIFFHTISAPNSANRQETFFQAICMSSLEDLISILDDQTKLKVVEYIFANKSNLDFEFCLKSPTIKFYSDLKDSRKIASENEAKKIADQVEAKKIADEKAYKAKADENAFNELKSKALIFYAVNLKADIKNSPLFDPKDEFESTSLYQSRQKKAEEFKIDLINKYTYQYKEYVEKKEIERIEKIKNSYSQVNLSISQLGIYDSERQIFPITFEGLRPLEINIPIQEAKSFKENLYNVKVIADKQLSEDAESYHFFNFIITHPITGSKYTLRPSAPLYLDYISKNIMESGVPKLEADVKFIDPSGNNILDGNETVKFEVTLFNTGTASAQNIRIFLSTPENNGFTFDKSKMLTGIASNQKQTVVFEINADRKLLSKEISFIFNFSEARGFNPADINYTIKTQSYKNPNLVVKDVVIKEINGNNNSMIENGEIIEVSVLVQNTGQGKAENTKAVFDLVDKNILTLSPDKMIQNIGEIESGDSRLLAFDFTVNNIYSGNDLLPIKVILSEKYNEYGGTFPLMLEMKKIQLTAKNIKVNGQYDQKIEINDISLTIDTDKNIPETGIRNPNRYALIIGNEDYKSFQSNLNSEVNVLFAENDALIFKEYAIKTLGVPEENVILKTNARFVEMNREIEKFRVIAKNSNGTAELIFYYAGHGFPDEISKEPYLMPVDVSATDLKYALKLNDIYSKLTEFPCKRVTVFLDACFSGGARNQGLMAARGVKIRPKEGLLNGNLVVFAAASGEQSALPYNEKGHGLFTYFLLKKLQEANSSITYGELSDYLTNTIGIKSVMINNKEQNPNTNVSPAISLEWRDWKIN
jgi:hypothetical protein